jgi:hypothetical protein
VFLANTAGALEQPPYLSPTVFNFYPPDYSPDSTLVSPASALLDSASVFARANLLLRLLYSPPGPDRTVTGATGTQVGLGDLAPYGTDSGSLASSIDALLYHGTLSESARLAILDAVNAQPSSGPSWIRAAAYVVLTSPQYQVER